jgi:cell division protein FtsI (penicillin-binding protein 3)
MHPVDSADRKRLVAIALGLYTLFCLVLIRFYQIQIVQHDRWTEYALAQHQHIVTEPFMRGCFYSNTSIKEGHPEDEQPFVIDVQKFHLFIDPDSIPAAVKPLIAAQLLAKLPITAAEKKELEPEFYRKSRSRKLVMWLSLEQKEEIEAWWKGFCKETRLVRNALFFTTDYKRSYPFGSMLGAVLHTVQEEKDPQTQQALPTGGLEMLYNRYLKGKSGKKRITRSPRHPLDTGTVLVAPEHGANVYLTINHYLQAIVEAELAKGVQAVNGKGGWAVMMDPKTGEILALAQVPCFHPARYREYYNDPAKQDLTKVRAVTDCFEPGSIFKAVSVAIALRASEELIREGKKPLLHPEEWVATADGRFPGRTKPIKDARVHRLLNMDLGVQKSSNIYMGRIIQRVVDTMGDQWYRNALTELFGFGKKTGVELPAETVGLVPMPGRLHPNGKPEWSVPTPYSLAMGYNILVNSMQVVRAYAIIANGGQDVKPHLVRKIVKKWADGSTKILVDNTKQGTKKQILTQESARRLVRSMKFVTKEGGTSRRADVPGYTEAGKSGTAEKIIDGIYSKDHHISSFVGFAPADAPRFVLLVSIDDPEKKFVPGIGKQQMGGVSAAPVFREIAAKTLQYLGVAPDDPYGYPYGDPRRDPKKADWVAEMEALKEAYRKHN